METMDYIHGRRSIRTTINPPNSESNQNDQDDNNIKNDTTDCFTKDVNTESNQADEDDNIKHDTIDGLIEDIITEPNQADKDDNIKHNITDGSVKHAITYTYWLMLGISIIIIIVALFLNHFHYKQNIESCEINGFERDFPNQEERLWKSIRAGLKTSLIKDQPKPSVFLFVYDDQKTLHKFTNKLLNTTSDCYGTDQPLILNSADLSTKRFTENYGAAIDTFKPQLEKSGIMLVYNLNQIPASSARMFHIICDTIEPFVPRSVIFMTMTMKLDKSSGRILKDVENYLRLIWHDLKEEILGPLLARVTDQVFFIKSENRKVK